MTTETLTLTDFLMARIAEDETLARGGFLAWQSGVAVRPAPPEHMWPRLLAEAEAKRRIVERAQELARIPDMDEETCGRAFEYDDHVLTTLAAVYADHPDYRDEWRP